MYLILPWKPWLFKTATFSSTQFKPLPRGRYCELPSHWPLVSILELSVDFSWRGLSILCLNSPSPLLFHRVSQTSLSPLSVPMNLQWQQGICWYWHLGLLCSPGYAEDCELLVVLFAILRDFMEFWARVCGEIQIRWQRLSSRFGNSLLSTLEGNHLSRLTPYYATTSWWKAVRLLGSSPYVLESH